jgi:hypothetical protein
MKNFDLKTLLKMLDELNAALRQRGKHLEIKIYGGAAMLLYYGESARFVTNDVDGVILNLDEFGRDPEIFENVRAKFDLKDDWINSSIKNVLIYLIEEVIVDYKQYSNLIIRLPSKYQLLAMKVLAGRLAPKHDYEDAMQLIADLGITSRTELTQIVHSFIPGYKMQDEQMDFIELLVIGAGLE